jgi:hypothetical protein
MRVIRALQVFSIHIYCICFLRYLLVSCILLLPLAGMSYALGFHQYRELGFSCLGFLLIVVQVMETHFLHIGDYFHGCRREPN